MSVELPHSLLRSLSRRHRDVMRFAVVGLSNAVLGYFLFLGIVRLSGSAGLAQFLTYSAGIVWSFYWNRRWTFGSAGRLGPEAVRFLVLQGIMAVGSSALVAVLSARLPISVSFIWVFVTGVTTVLNYLGSKFLVFRSKRPDQA